MSALDELDGWSRPVVSASSERTALRYLLLEFLENARHTLVCDLEPCSCGMANLVKRAIEFTGWEMPAGWSKNERA